jgi:hypothetical protein
MKDRHLLSKPACGLTSLEGLWMEMDAPNTKGAWRRCPVCLCIRTIVIFVVCISGLQSCTASPTVPDFYSVGSTEEQRTIGEYYRSEAAMFRQKADQMDERVRAYRQLFGEESEWVSGARALGEYYQGKHKSGNVSRNSTNRHRTARYLQGCRA